MPWRYSSGRGERCNVCHEIIPVKAVMWVGERAIDICWCLRDCAAAGKTPPASLEGLEVHQPRKLIAAPAPIQMNADAIGKAFPGIARAVRRHELDTAEKMPTRRRREDIEDI